MAPSSNRWPIGSCCCGRARKSPVSSRTRNGRPSLNPRSRRSLKKAAGNWPLLGPWRDHHGAPDIPAGSSAYVTAWTISMLEHGGVKDNRIELGRTWLRQHQNPEGYWGAVSMNKKYEPGSMQELFMRNATTAWAVVALTEP